jgi:hypothetical protein
MQKKRRGAENISAPTVGWAKVEELENGSTKILSGKTKKGNRDCVLQTLWHWLFANSVFA